MGPVVVCLPAYRSVPQDVVLLLGLRRNHYINSKEALPLYLGSSLKCNMLQVAVPMPMGIATCWMHMVESMMRNSRGEIPMMVPLEEKIG